MQLTRMMVGRTMNEKMNSRSPLDIDAPFASAASPAGTQDRATQGCGQVMYGHCNHNDSVPNPGLRVLSDER
jgi:hypothetical protein